MSSTLVHLDLWQFEAPCYGGVCFTQPYISSLLSPIWLPTLSHYPTSRPEHCSHPAVLISPRAVPHVLSQLVKWVASNLANPFPCCLGGTTTDSCPWFSSVKPSEAPATKASYFNMKTDSLGELHTYVQNRYCQGNNKKYKQQNPIC